MSTRPLSEKGELVPEDETAALLTNPYLPDGENGKRRRVSKWTPALKRRFCQALAEGASPSKAAHALELSRSGVYYQRSVDPDFAAAWDEALELAADLYEDRLHDLAVGDRNPASVIFQLKNRRPDRWRDRHEVDQRIEYHHTFSVEELPPERQEALAKLALERLAAQKLQLPTPAPGRDDKGGDSAP